MAVDLSEKYPPTVLEKRAQAESQGSFREKVRYDVLERPNYAFGLLAAADMAKFCGQKRFTAIEFGIAEGKGLLNLCELAPLVTQETGIEIDILGFDTGEGLPELVDERDHPEIWSAGDFGGVDKAALEAKLPANARIIWGDIRDTLAVATRSLPSPVGFIANDLDLYSSTLASFSLLQAPCEKLLPVIVTYFDDTLGCPTRIGSLFRNRWCGQLAAIEDFNVANEERKIDRMYAIEHRRPMNRELWLEKMYAVHVLDHPLRQTGAERSPLTMHSHGVDDKMLWPL